MPFRNRLLAAVTLPICAAIVFTAAWMTSAGDLNPPPGVIAPTHKTMTEVEPRKSINTLPGTALAHRAITQPGSYYLTTDLVSTLSGEIGILVNASNVSIDLVGFNVLGAGGSGSGIHIQSGQSGISIRNGRLAGWGGFGIDASGAARVVIQQIQVSGNSAGGIHIGTDSSITDCHAWQNSTGLGFRVSGDRSRLDGNSALGNSVGFRVTGSANLVTRNMAQNNAAGDFDIAPLNNYAQILASPGPGFLTANAWANFSGCPIGQTSCGGQCVNIQSDVNNCGACNAPCVAPPNASVSCVNGVCQFTCNPGFADCNGNPVDGCEINIMTNPLHCGGCNNPCTAQAQSTCGRTGGCVAGVCQLYPAGTVCTAPTCSNGVFQPADVCNGTGTCVDGGLQPCTPYACNGTTGCRTSCTIDTHCAPGFYCSGNICVPKKPPGAPCNNGNECISGVCNGNVCQ